jgi:hypothetical protein
MKGPWIAVPCAVCMALAGCAQQLPEPNVASSAAEPAYAASYPARLQAIAKQVDDDESTARTLQGRYQRYADELDNPPWDVVLTIVRSAHAAGRSQGYVEARRSFAASHAFFEEEGPDLTKKVAGTAQYVVKEKGCSAEVTGPISHALKEGVDKQSEKRLRAGNEAQRQIEEYRDTLGKKNAAALERHADELAEVTYLIDINMVEQKLALRRMLAEAEQVKKTIPDALVGERAFQSGAGRTDAEKQASHQRIEALNKAQGELESAIANARKLDQAIEQRIEAARKAHQESFQKVESILQSRAPAKK